MVVSVCRPREAKPSLVAVITAWFPAPVDYRKQINNRLSHISQRRADLKHEEKFWDDLHTKLDELEAAWQGFLRALEANYPERVEWFTLVDFTLEDSADEQE